MKIRKDTLVDFLKKTTMTGVSALTECILDFTNKGIKVSSTSANNNVLITTRLNAKSIDEYKPIGQIAIHNLQDVVKLLEGFNKEYIKFGVKDNKAIFSSSNRKVKVTLMDKDAVQKPSEYPKDLKERLLVVFDVDILKNFFRNMNMVSSSEFSFIIKGKDFYFNTKSFNEVTEKVEIKDSNKKTNIHLTLNKAFIDAVENLDGEVALELKSNYPVTVTSKTKEYIVKILVAPVIQEET